MAFTSKQLVARANRDPELVDESEASTRDNLERAMRILVDIYTSGSHKVVWNTIDHYALHGLVTSYALSNDEELSAIKDLEIYESTHNATNPKLRETLNMVDTYLWPALTCDTRSQFAEICEPILKACHKSREARRFCRKLLRQLLSWKNEVPTTPGEQVIANIVSRLNVHYDKQAITKYLKRVHRLESLLSLTS